MKIRGKIRLAWSFAGCDAAHDRLDVLVRKMRNAGFPRAALDAVLGDRVQLIADVEVDETGTLSVLAVRRLGACGAKSREGLLCTKDEEHGPQHVHSHEEGEGCVVVRWKDGEGQ